MNGETMINNKKIASELVKLAEQIHAQGEGEPISLPQIHRILVNTVHKLLDLDADISSIEMLFNNICQEIREKMND